MPSPPKLNSEIGLRFISDAIKRDHRDLEKLCASLSSAVLEPHAREGEEVVEEVQKKLTWNLARHLVGMSLFVFPGTETRAAQGSEMALRRKGEYDEVSEFVVLSQ